MAADGINYRDAVIIATVKINEDGNPYLDLPFPIYCQEIVINGQMGLTIPVEKDGQEVLANVHYKVEDDAVVKAFAGYVADYHNDPRVRPHWNVQVKTGELKAFACSGAQLDTANKRILVEKQLDYLVKLGITAAQIEAIKSEAVAEREEKAVEPVGGEKEVIGLEIGGK